MSPAGSPTLLRDVARRRPQSARLCRCLRRLRCRQVPTRGWWAEPPPAQEGATGRGARLGHPASPAQRRWPGRSERGRGQATAGRFEIRF